MTSSPGYRPKLTQYLNTIITRPNTSLVLAYIGVALFLISGLVASSSPIPAAHAIDCSKISNFLSGGDTYTNVWKVQNWLTLDKIPMGPSNWQVTGHTKTTSGDVCYQENWELESVLWQSTSDPRRGKVIYRSPSVLDGGFEGSTLSFTTPAGLTDSGSVQKCSGGFFGIRPSGCQADTFARDPAFNPGSGSWNTMGLYGVMRNSKDDLKTSRGYIPYEWQVHGTF